MVTGDLKDYDLVRGRTINMIWAMNKAYEEVWSYHNDGYAALQVKIDLPNTPNLTLPYSNVTFDNHVKLHFNFGEEKRRVLSTKELA